MHVFFSSAGFMPHAHCGHRLVPPWAACVSGRAERVKYEGAR
jgi:hypothetical protein